VENAFDVADPDKGELRRIYNDRRRYGWTYDQLGGYEDFCDRYRMHAIVRAVERQKPASVLDNGCGSAVISRELASRGYAVTGVDISDDLLRMVPQHPNLRLIAADSDALPFPDSSFSCVICSEVLEHIQDNGPAIREIRRVMDPDGVAIITVPNWGCYDSLEGNFGIVTRALGIVNFLLGLVRRRPIYEHGVNMHFHKMFPWQWKRLLESHGLEVVEEQAVFLSPYIPKIRFVERKIYHVPGLFGLKVRMDDLLSPRWPFKYFGLSHLFVCKKRR
jgi:SAM-dependent methyltransferase